MIVDDTDVYVQVPGTEEQVWARVELSRLTEGDVGFGGPGGLPFQSPQDNLAVLQDAVTQATEAGVEDVRGDAATRYDLTIDVQRAVEQTDAETEANQTFDSLTEQSGINELDMQVWIDSEDRIRRITYTVDLSEAEVEVATEGAEVDADPTGTVSVTLEYFGFGIL